MPTYAGPAVFLLQFAHLMSAGSVDSPDPSRPARFRWNAKTLTVETESIDTPAGTFTARRVEYTGTGRGGTVTWFLADGGPGHVVEYRAESGGDEW